MTTLAEELVIRATLCLEAVGFAAKAEMQHIIDEEDIIETGTLRDSIEAHDVTFHGTHATLKLACRAVNDRGRHYASFQDTGTGVYAGNGPIVHPTAYFHFFWRRMGGAETWLQEVQGTPPTHFWSDGIEAIDLHIFREAWNAVV